jgi:hypothetical protein
MEREAIRWRLAAYLEGGRGEDPEAFHGRAAPAAEGEARQCREWLKAGLAELAQGQTWVIQLEFRPRYFIGLKPPHVYRRAPMTDALVPFREVVLRDSVPLLLKRLKFCARNGCGAAFFSRKRQLFCSGQCGQSERTARFRAKHAAWIKKRRRERYVADMRKKHGPNVKVGIRSTRRRRSADGN